MLFLADVCLNYPLNDIDLTTSIDIPELVYQKCFPNAQSKYLLLNIKPILVLDDRIGNILIQQENVSTKLEGTVNVLEPRE